MAIKSGTRYVDELATIEKSNIVKAFIDEVEPEIQKRENKVKASFKIEINEEEKVARDSTTTNVYHTGLVLSDADKKELELDRLQQIEEEGIQEEEDEDDPDEDLDF